MTEGKLDQIKRIVRKPVARTILAGVALGTAIGGLAPLPNPSPVEGQEPPRATAALVNQTPFPSPTETPIPTSLPTLEPTPTPTPTPEPTRRPIVGATAPRETPPSKIEFFTKDGELSYSSFFYFQRETKPEDRDRVIKEIIDKPATILIDRSDVWARQPSRNSEFFVIGPEGKKYAYVNLGDGYPILLTPEQYLDFLNKGWVGGSTGRKEVRAGSTDNPYLSYMLMKGTKLHVEVVNLPRPNGETQPTFIFKGIAVPEVDPNRPTDFMTKEGDISFEKFFNAKNTWGSILNEMLGEMAGKEVSIMFDGSKKASVISGDASHYNMVLDGKGYKILTMTAGGTTTHLLLTPEQYQTFKKSGWDLGSRHEFKALPPSTVFPSGSSAFFSEDVPLGATIKGKIGNEPDEYGRVYFLFQGITLPKT